MRFKGTIFLTILLISLGLYVYFVELPGDAKKRAAEIKKARLFSFEMSEITRVRIRSAKNEIELEYFPGHPSTPWRIYDPVETVANERAGDEIAAFLSDLKSSRLVEEKPKNLKDFGLDPPLYTVIITLQKNDTEIVEVGSENLTGSDVYVRIGEGTSLYLVRAGIKDILNKDLFGWRRQEIFPYEPPDISRIQLLSGNALLGLKKDSKGWSMQIDQATASGSRIFRADRNEVANLLGSIVSLRGERFVDYGKDAMKARFAPPIMRLTLKISKVEREVSFYTDDEMPDIINVVASPIDPIFQVSKKALKIIQQSFEQYRSKGLIYLDFPGEIEGVEIIRPEERFLLRKREDRWWMDSSGAEVEMKEVANKDLILDLTGDIFNMRVNQFLDELDPSMPKAGLSDPQVTIRLMGREERFLGEIVFGASEGDLLYAKSSDQNGLFFLKNEDLKKIPRKKDLQ